MIVFRYKEEPTGRDGESVRRPVADVFLRSSDGKWLEFHPYIDPGADVTLIPLSLGKLADFRLAEKEIQEIGGLRGSIPVIYLQNELKIGNCLLNAQIAWALIEEVPPLLGRADVFDFFHVTFRQDESLIIFEAHPFSSD